MNFRTLLTCSAAMLVLAACASTPEEEPAPVTQAETVSSPDPVAVPTEDVDQSAMNDIPETQPPVPGSLDDFLYQTGGDARVYFGYDQYDLTPAAMETLRRQAQWLNTYTNVSAVVEGNADERGTREYNLALGARRAESVKDFLVSQGVSPSRLTTVSYGKERPIDPRSNEEGWSINRNGHTNLMSGTIS